MEAPEMTKALVVMAPHTSMIDFIHGKLYFSSCGYKPKFLMKAEMFKWPLSPILRALGAVPIDRSKRVGQIRHTDVGGNLVFVGQTDSFLGLIFQDL